MGYLEQLKSRKSSSEQVPIVTKPNIDTFGTNSTGHIQKMLRNEATLHIQPNDTADNAFPSKDKLLDALANSCRGLTITPEEVLDALTTEDIEDWRKGRVGIETLGTFVQSLAQRREMDQGKRPVHYTERATCKHCGPIWLWFSGEVMGCPWCWNRVAGRPIPRPSSEEQIIPSSSVKS